MKKLLLFFMYWGLLTGLEAQVWEVPICRQLDESRVKMLKLIPKMELTIRTLKPVMDSVKEEITYKGHLNSGSEGSLNLNLEEYRTVKLYPNGIRQTTTMPPDVYLKNESPGNGIKSIALEDIDFIKVQKWPKAVAVADGVLEPVIFASLFVLIASPLISYNYKEGYMNTETYKSWALGSTLTMTSCFAVLMVINSQSKSYQFQSGWPEKKAKVWKFKLAQR